MILLQPPSTQPSFTFRRPHARATAPPSNASRHPAGAFLHLLRPRPPTILQAGQHHAASISKDGQRLRSRPPPHSLSSSPYASRPSWLSTTGRLAPIQPGLGQSVWLPTTSNRQLKISSCTKKPQPATTATATGTRDITNTKEEVVNISKSTDPTNHQHTTRRPSSTGSRGECHILL